MELILGKTAGFCYGVNNAVTKAKEFALKRKNKTIYCLGELVHNKRVVKELEEEGIIFIDNLSEIKDVETAENDISVMIRAHGEPKSTYEILKKRNIEILDLTCPSVISIHNSVEKKTNDGYYVFLIGHKNHPETIATYDFCNGECSIIEESEDVEESFNEFVKHNKNKIFIVAQTTFKVEKFNSLCEEIKNKINSQKEEYMTEKNIEIINTICNSTKIRQDETENISKNVEYMIIIGGKNSSNTKKLYEIASKNCNNSIHIESYKELEENPAELEKIRMAKKVGIMAGASTPKVSIEEVRNFL